MQPGSCRAANADGAAGWDGRHIDGDTLTAEAGDGIGTLSQGMLTGTLNTKLVVKLLGAQKETTTELGGRTVLSHAKFGSMTGAPHPSMHGGVGRHTAIGTHAHQHAASNLPLRSAQPSVFVRGRGGGQHG